MWQHKNGTSCDYSGCEKAFVDQEPRAIHSIESRPTEVIQYRQYQRTLGGCCHLLLQIETTSTRTAAFCSVRTGEVIPDDIGSAWVGKHLFIRAMAQDYQIKSPVEGLGSLSKGKCPCATLHIPSSFVVLGQRGQPRRGRVRSPTIAQAFMAGHVKLGRFSGRRQQHSSRDRHYRRGQIRLSPFPDAFAKSSHTCGLFVLQEGYEQSQEQKSRNRDRPLAAYMHFSRESMQLWEATSHFSKIAF
jgi:hypothetical protein